MEGRLSPWQGNNYARKSRAIMSCLPCHQRKVKCDRGRPCGRCVVARQTDDCAYQTEREASSPGTQPRLAFPVIGAFVNGRAHLGHANSWMILCWKFEEARSYLFGLNPDPEYQEIQQRIKSLKYLLLPKPGDDLDIVNQSIAASPHPNSKIEFLLSLLSREAVDVLVANYVQTFDTIIPLWNRAELDRDIAQFWMHPDDTDVSFLAQLFLMLSISCHSAPAKNPILRNFNLSFVSKTLFSIGDSMLNRVGPRDLYDLARLRSLCMMAMAKMIGLGAANDAPDCTVLLGTAVRTAQSMALHRHPLRFPGMSESEGISRLILWTGIVFLDQLISVHTNLAPQTRNAEYDAYFRFDCYLSWNKALDASCDNCHALFITSMCEMLQISSPVLERLNVINPNLDYDEVKKLDKNLRNFLRDTLPKFAGGHDFVRASMQRCLVEVFIRRILLDLHQPFTQDAASSSAAKLSQVAVLECALSLIICQEGLYAPTTQDGGAICLSDLHKEDFGVAIIYISLGLRKGDFKTISFEALPGCPTEIAWRALRRAAELTKINAINSPKHFRIYAGAVQLVAVLEALESQIPIIEKMKEAGRNIIAWMENQVVADLTFDSLEMGPCSSNEEDLYNGFTEVMDFLLVEDDELAPTL